MFSIDRNGRIKHDLTTINIHKLPIQPVGMLTEIAKLVNMGLGDETIANGLRQQETKPRSPLCCI